MGARKEFYISLIRELLGPRNGSHEVMELDPRDEYIVGILEPKDYTRGSIDDYSNSDLKREVPSDKGALRGGEFEEDNTDDAEVDQFDSLPVLDPKALPKSMGISFVIETQDNPLINICATWARYLKEDGKWKRYPKSHIIENCDIRSELTAEIDKGVLLRTKSVQIEDKKWHVSVYMVNISRDFKNTIETRHLIFQPQIRINLPDGVNATSLLERPVEGEDEKRLAMLYRDLPAFARGHMCSAVWSAVDQERPYEGRIPEDLVPPDIKLLNERQQEIFTNPHIRSEYLPIYSVVQSTTEVGQIDGMEDTDMHSGLLSEKWDSDLLVKNLEKLVNAYEIWIAGQRKESDTLVGAHKQIAEKNLDSCEQSLSRMKGCIRILQTDEDARLSFYFMNRAMCLQSEWVRKRPLVWRPFQMAFIMQCIPGIIDGLHHDREICDLLWFPTGGGKTEAYLGLIIFTLSYLRRKKDFFEKSGFSSSGTSVISRYTLRLLTIQQFRRTLNAVTAAEVLRTMDWKPSGYSGSHLWGDRRFSIGLWIGGGVTPNSTIDHEAWDNENKIMIRFAGAISRLTYRHESRTAREKTVSEGEPAQVLECPSCSEILAVPKTESDLPSIISDKGRIFWVVSASREPKADKKELSNERFSVTDFKIHRLPKDGFYIAEIHFVPTRGRINDYFINEWCNSTVLKVLGARLECASASRPGYFIKRLEDTHRTPIDFEIRCPNPECILNKHEWSESTDTGHFSHVSEPFEIPNKKGYSKGIPLPAFTTDAQVYHRCPSIVLATVDKFARLPFEPRCSSIFGNVDRYDPQFGYYRKETLPDTGNNGKLSGMIRGVNVKPFLPPQLIIQDELHLIEGPLGSLVGLYEIAIDSLATYSDKGKLIRPKYIASTATIRQANDQVNSLYSKTLSQFPSQGINILDNFFSRTVEEHPIDDNKAGRLYMGICAPGKGPQTPIVRIWSDLLQNAEILKRNNGGKVDPDLDQFWTVVGYFNAIRELAQVTSLYRQDIPERIKSKYGTANARVLDFPVELSSRKDSMELPSILRQLEKYPDNEIDAVVATSMFGTGVDVDRLGIMIVHGQPKTTASYIQSTGRVGRKKGALVATFLRSTRPRDLDHYEFFIGYHRVLHRQVEPVTVAPFSIRAIERALGPVLVSILRNAHSVNGVDVNSEWSAESRPSRSGSRNMFVLRNSKELEEIIKIIVNRSKSQPENRRKDPTYIENLIKSDLDRWTNISRTEPSLLYYEPSMLYLPENPVVLGDAQHKKHSKKQVFENVPQSLREVEQTARFEG